MNNLEFLKDQIKYTGFGEGYESQLKEKIGKELPEFQINHRAEYGKDVVTATLDFSKSKSSDLYFFNSYKVELKPEGAAELMTQTFQIGTKNNITLKEAYNLLNGRAIHKEFNKVEKQGEGESARYAPTDEKYLGWKVMNFKETTKNGSFKLDTYTDAYGFDLKQELAKLPIRDLQDKVASDRLIESLHKGNRAGVTLLEGDKELPHFLAANPRFKRLDLYDANLQKVDLSQDQKTSQQASLKQGLSEHGTDENKKSQRNSSKKSVA